MYRLSHIKAFAVQAVNPGTILINVWDDSPPAAPIIIEGDYADNPNVFKLYQYLREIAWRQNPPYQIYEYGHEQRPDDRFAIENPEWPGAEGRSPWPGSGRHQEFLDKIKAMYEQAFENQGWDGYPVKIISES